MRIKLTSKNRLVTYRLLVFILIFSYLFADFSFLGPGRVIAPAIPQAQAAKANGIAWLYGTSTTNSTNFNQVTAYDMNWTGGDFDDSIFSWSGSPNPERLYVDQDGDYLIAISAPMQRADSNAVRSRVETLVYVNGSKVDIGTSRSSYIRLSSSHSESSNHLHVLLEDLTNGDYITVKMRSAPSSDRTGTSYATTAVGQVSIYAEYIDNDETIFTGTATQTTLGTDLNQGVAELEWSESREDAGYTHDNATNPEDITIATAGNYLVMINIPWGDPEDNEDNRPNLIGEVLLGGSPVTGTQFANGYIRGNSNASNGDDQESSFHFAGFVETTVASQVLSIQLTPESETGTITMDGEKATIYIQKLPDTSNLFVSRGTQLRTDQTDWNPSGKTNIEWESDLVIDTNTYTHSTSTNPHQITVKQPGDYMLVFNGAFTSTAQRPNNRITVQVDSTDVTGAATMTNYIRNSSAHDNASTTLVFLLSDLTADQVITVSSQQEGNSGTINDADSATILLWRKPNTGPSLNQLHYRWRDDSTDLNTTGGWLASEDTGLSGNADRFTTYRLRFSAANTGSADQSAGNAYQLQWGITPLNNDCTSISTWTGVDYAADAFDMVASGNIDPDGESTTAGLMANSEGYTRISGAGMDSSDASGTLGALSQDNYTELEYSIVATGEAETGRTYCFRLYDSTNDQSFVTYSNYPQLTIDYVSQNTVIGEYGTVSLSSNTPSTVNLSSTYSDLVVVASPRYAPDTDAARSARLTSKSSNSFNIKVDNYAASLTGSTTVDWLAIEAGTHTILDGGSGTKIIADTQNTSAQAYNGGDFTSGSVINFSPTFNNSPVVLHTVASNSDTGWTASMVNDGTREGEPTASAMEIMMMTSFDTSTHSAEDIDYVAIDPGYGTHNSVNFNAVVSPDTVACCTTSGYNFSWDTGAFSSAPGVTLVSQMGEDGGNGGFACTHTGSTTTSTTYYASSDEDGPSADRGHTLEIVGALAFQSSSGTIISDSITVDQLNYRFYANADSVQPGTALASENTSAANITASQVIRLRLSLQVGKADLSTGEKALKLQYGEGSNCSAIVSWSDVDDIGGSGIWRGYNNATAVDGNQISSSLLNDQNNNLESYVEENNSPTNPAGISQGENGEWDFVVQNNGATANTDYCFRTVLSDDSILHYSRYPQLTTSSTISISLNTDGSVSFGNLGLNATEDTTASGLDDTETVSVDTGPVDLDIRSTVFTEGGNTWTLDDTNGSNQVKWEFSPNGSSWSTFSLANTLYTLASDVSQGATQDVYYRLTTPTSSSSYDQYSSTITIVASSP